MWIDLCAFAVHNPFTFFVDVYLLVRTTSIAIIGESTMKLAFQTCHGYHGSQTISANKIQWFNNLLLLFVFFAVFVWLLHRSVVCILFISLYFVLWFQRLIRKENVLVAVCIIKPLFRLYFEYFLIIHSNLRLHIIIIFLYQTIITSLRLPSDIFFLLYALIWNAYWVAWSQLRVSCMHPCMCGYFLVCIYFAFISHPSAVFQLFL